MTDTPKRFPPPSEATTRDVRPPSSDRMQQLRSRIDAQYIDDDGMISHAEAGTRRRDRMHAERQSHRERRPSAMAARADAVTLLADRLRSSRDLVDLPDSAWMLLHQVVGSAFDLGESRGEVRRQELLTRIAEMEAEIVDAEARAINAECSHQRERLSGPPPSETQMDALARCADRVARLEQRCAWLAGELDARGVRVPPMRESE